MISGWVFSVGLRLALGTATPSIPSAPIPKGGEPVPAETQIHLEIMLTVGDPAAAKSAQQQALRTRRHAAVQDDDAAMGQSDETVARIKRWLRAGGFTPADLPSHMLVAAEGTAAQVNRAFATRLKKFPKKSAAVHWPDPKPKLPEWLQPLVIEVVGLDTRPLPKPKGKKPRE